MKHTGERGPIYGVWLIDELPVGGMFQCFPGKRELQDVKNKVGGRTVAAFEVLLSRFLILNEACNTLLKFCDTPHDPDDARTEELNALHAIRQAVIPLTTTNSPQATKS